MWNVSAAEEPLHRSAAAVWGQFATGAPASASAAARKPAAAKLAAPAVIREARVMARS
jgi:hypothetical protein